MSSGKRSAKSQLRKLLAHYLRAFGRQSEVGLITFKQQGLEHDILSTLQDCGLMRADSWVDIMRCLGSGESTFIQLKPPLDQDLYEIITQYYRRGGTIQMFNVERQETERVDFAPFETHLLLVSNIEDLHVIEAKFNICDKVGMFESIPDQ